MGFKLSASHLRIALAAITVLAVGWGAVNVSSASQLYSSAGLSGFDSSSLVKLLLPFVAAIVSYIGSLAIPAIPKECATIAFLSYVAQKIPEDGGRASLRQSAHAAVDRLFDEVK